MNKTEITNLDDIQLENTLRIKSQEERKLSLEVIDLLAEVDCRKLYLTRGFGSLIEYCIKEFQYSESSAYRRISAMRIMREVPETKTAIQSGALNLSTLSQAQKFFRSEAKNKKSYSSEEKKELLTHLQNKSTREAEKVLLQISPESEVKEKVRQVSEDKTQVTLVISTQVIQKLNKLRNLLSHKEPNCNYSELIEVLADLALKKLDPVRIQSKASLGQWRDAKPAPVLGKKISESKKAMPSRYVPASVRRAVWAKSNGRCCYRDKNTGRVCGSTRFLELDHIDPYSLGGANTLENLQLLCDGHNRLKGNTQLDHMGQDN